MTDSTTPGAAATGAAAPGWYPDGSGRQRWWDGRGWTSYTAPAPGSAQPIERPALPEGAQPDTVWTWLIVLVGVVAAIPVFFFDYPGYMRGLITGQYGSAIGSFLVYSVLIMSVSWGSYAVTVVAAYRDYRHLVAIGVVRPFHWAFAFLGSLVYLIGRHVILRRVSRTPGWPLWALVALEVVLMIAVFVWMAIIMQQMFAMIPSLPSGGYR